jgi:hypothetical protein
MGITYIGLRVQLFMYSHGDLIIKKLKKLINF